ncbi:MAG: HAMP domain-containing histidine kinase [Anaerolineae bacterium]|nr:HAMP domain-containing histidine kinase [Anaerolineae bacterium]
MFRSLWFRLVGAMAVVIGVTLAVVTLTSNLVTVHQLDLYVTRAGRSWAEQIAPTLAEDYIRTGSWDSAQQTLAGTTLAEGEPGTGPGSGRGHMGAHSEFGGMWSMMGFRLLLADGSNIVVADTQNELQGETLSAAILAEGTPIIANGEQVGTLLATSDDPPYAASVGERLIPAINRAVIPAALAAGLAALLAGTLLFRRITRPLSDLQRAAKAVSEGELTTRVPITTTDELGALATSFNQMTFQLDRQQQLRKQMVADIAHELRTPLSVMQGTLEAMLDGVLQPEPDELRNLHAETRRLARLVDDLRTLSLADEGRLELEQEPVDIGGLVEQVVRQTTPMAEARHITLRAEVEQAVPTIRADGDRLIQALTNLLSNALRYTPQNGQVIVRASKVANNIRLEVEDDGPGIAPEDLPFVFERFWRGDKSRSRGSGGSGIGLAIVRQLVEMHGGTVGVQSQVGQGAMFWIELPVG